MILNLEFYLHQYYKLEFNRAIDVLALMNELKQIENKFNPDETLLVADALTGQDAVNVAKNFSKAVDCILDASGRIILTGIGKSGLIAKKISSTIVEARFCKPLDKKLILKLCNYHKALVTIEEGSIGGFGSHVLNFLLNNKLNIYKKLLVETIQLPDIFIDQDTPEKMYSYARMNSTNIAKRILVRLGL